MHVRMSPPSPSLSPPPNRGVTLGQSVVTLFGGLLAATSIGVAWFIGAGVTTVNTYPAPGPTLGSLISLVLCAATLGVGAGVIAAYGSHYVSDAETEATGVEPVRIRSRRYIVQGAIFLAVFGAGLLLMGLALPLTPSVGISHGPLPLYIQPSVMWVPASLIAAGLAGLGGAVVLFAMARRSSPVAARAWWRRTGRFAALGAVLVLVITVPMLTVPVSQSYTTTLRSFAGGAGAVTFTTFPQGADVRGTWQVSPEVQVNFTVQGAAYNLTQIGTSGSFSFIASGTPQPLYTFVLGTNVSATVALICHFNAPLWAWPPGEPGAPTNYD